MARASGRDCDHAFALGEESVASAAPVGSREEGGCGRITTARRQAAGVGESKGAPAGAINCVAQRLLLFALFPLVSMRCSCYPAGVMVREVVAVM